MERVRAPRSRVPLVAIPAVVVGLVLVAVLFNPATPTTPLVTQTAGSTNAAAASLVATQEATASATTLPPFTPFPRLTKPPCVLPNELPQPVTPAVTPHVTGTRVAMLFSAPLDEAPGVGLWFAPKGSETPRLLAATTPGMVMPLALAQAGDTAAVWWLPDRSPDSDACISGIYLVSTTLGTSRLIASGDWVTQEGDDQVNGTIWSDPDTNRTYRIPETSFSRDGTHLAVIDGDVIDLHGSDTTELLYRHVGSCTDWAWAPVRTTFVAGCEGMTSAWLFRADGSTSGTGEGDPPYNVALPWLRAEAVKSGWGEVAGHAIGLTRDDRIRVAGFYGVATGCEGDGPCSIPKPAYSVTTFDPGSNTASTQAGKLEFLLNVDADAPVRLSADASWIYASRAGGGARTIAVGSGAVAKATRLGRYAGAAIDGSVMFGYRVDLPTGSLVISALSAAGRTTDVATIRPPDVEHPANGNSVTQAYGLVVVEPSG